MSQLHKKLGDEQVKAILRNYQEGQMTRQHAQELLGLGKSRFFTLLQQYRINPTSMSIEYHRKAPGRISPEADQLIRQELKREKDLVEDQRLPISSYNYTALRDRLQKKGLPFPSQRSSKGQRNRIVIGLAVNRRFMIARSSPAPLGK